jgi:hypothetical protein
VEIDFEEVKDGNDIAAARGGNTEGAWDNR